MQGSTLHVLVVLSQFARGFGCRVMVAHQDRARSWLPGEGLRGYLHMYNARPWVLTPSLVCTNCGDKKGQDLRLLSLSKLLPPAGAAVR